MSRHYLDVGGVADGEYRIQVHLAGDGLPFCSLLVDGESRFPGNIEYIEYELFQEEAAEVRYDLETVLTPETERVDDPPIVGTAYYDDGVLERLEWDLSELMSDG